MSRAHTTIRAGPAVKFALRFVWVLFPAPKGGLPYGAQVASTPLVKLKVLAEQYTAALRYQAW
jgi:hypothetical protein